VAAGKNHHHPVEPFILFLKKNEKNQLLTSNLCNNPADNL